MSRIGSPSSGEVTGSYGTVDDSWQGSALADASLGNFALHADAFVRDAGDYDTPLGKQTNSFFRGHGEALGGSYFFDGGDSHIGVNRITGHTNHSVADRYADFRAIRASPVAM